MRPFSDELKAEIQVRVRLPWAEQEKAYNYVFDREQIMDALRPLPRDREINPFEQHEAMKQYDRRKRLIGMVAQAIAAALMNACEMEDTDHGYRKT